MAEFWEELSAVLTDGGIEACVGVLGGGPTDGGDDGVSVPIPNAVVAVNGPMWEPAVIVSTEKRGQGREKAYSSYDEGRGRSVLGGRIESRQSKKSVACGLHPSP